MKTSTLLASLSILALGAIAACGGPAEPELLEIEAPPVEPEGLLGKLFQDRKVLYQCVAENFDLHYGVLGQPKYVYDTLKDDYNAVPAEGGGQNCTIAVEAYYDCTPQVVVGYFPCNEDESGIGGCPSPSEFTTQKRISVSDVFWIEDGQDCNQWTPHAGSNTGLAYHVVEGQLKSAAINWCQNYTSPWSPVYAGTCSKWVGLSGFSGVIGSDAPAQ